MENKDKISTNQVSFWISTRFYVAVLLFFGAFCAYSMRVNINMSIVCMVNHTALKMDSNNSNGLKSSACGIYMSPNNTEKPKDGPFVWDRTVQGNILGAFFWPYAVFQIPIGMLVTKLGARRIYGCLMMVAGLMTVLTPELSKLSHVATLVVRASLGIILACVFTSSQYMLGRWVPLHERSRLSSLCFAGVEIGTIFTYFTEGIFCKQDLDDGWSFIFYLTGIFTFLWSILWLFSINDTPGQSKRISEAERKYITSYIQESEKLKSDKIRMKDIPWKGIFTSVPVYAIIVANFASDWAFFFMATYVPTYLNDVYRFDIQLNGLLSSLPSIPIFLVTLFGGWLSDCIQNRYLSRTKTRKLFTTISMVIPALLLLTLGYIDCDFPALAIALLVISMALRGFRYAGFFENPLDIAPYYAGIIFGISNSVGAIGGYLSTVMAANVTKNSTREEWRICFYITTAIETLGALFYICFASSDRQISYKDSDTEVTVHNIDNSQSRY